MDVEFITFCLYRYRYERDDDINNMEASYNEIAREEARRQVNLPYTILYL